MFRKQTCLASLVLVAIHGCAIILLAFLCCERCVAQETELQAKKQSKTAQTLIDLGVNVSPNVNPRAITFFSVPSDGRSRRIVVPWKRLAGLSDLESVSMQARKIGEDTIDFFKRCPKLETITLSHCSFHIGEESLIWLSKKNLELSKYARIHKTTFTAAGIKALSELECPDLGFRDCSFTQDAVDALGINFDNQHLSFAESKGLTVNDLIDRFGERARYLHIPWPNQLVLSYGSEEETWRGQRVTWEGNIDLQDDCLEKMPKLYGVTLKARSLSILAALEKSQPNIKLFQSFRNNPTLNGKELAGQLSHLEYQDRFFDMVEATPSLDQLRLNHAYAFQEGGRPMRLTTDHRLRFLRIDSLQPFGKDLIAEATKPRFLIGLSVNHSNVLGAEEIQQIITKSKDLRNAKFNADKLTDEATALLRGWASEIEYSR